MLNSNFIIFDEYLYVSDFIVFDLNFSRNVYEIFVYLYL